MDSASFFVRFDERVKEKDKVYFILDGVFNGIALKSIFLYRKLIF